MRSFLIFLLALGSTLASAGDDCTWTIKTVTENTNNWMSCLKECQDSLKSPKPGVRNTAKAFADIARDSMGIIENAISFQFCTDTDSLALLGHQIHAMRAFEKTIPSQCWTPELPSAREDAENEL